MAISQSIKPCDEIISKNTLAKNFAMPINTYMCIVCSLYMIYARSGFDRCKVYEFMVYLKPAIENVMARLSRDALVCVKPNMTGSVRIKYQRSPTCSRAQINNFMIVH